MGQTMDYEICIEGHDNSGAYRARWVTHEGRGTGKLENIQREVDGLETKL